MSAKVRRYLKSKPGVKRKMFFEKRNLEFLKGVPFFAIAEHKQGGKTEIFIEFKPRSIKNIIIKAKAFRKLNNDLQEIQRENNELKWTLKRLEGSLKLLNTNYKLVPLAQDKIDPKDRSPKSYLNVLQECSNLLRGLPLQGGLPSLGKKSR